LHVQRDTARYLIEDKQAAYVFTAVKDNPRTLFTRLDALPWPQIPVAYRTEHRGHRRVERRSTQVLPAPDQVSPTLSRRF